jgi:hypothetical protein
MRIPKATIKISSSDVAAFRNQLFINMRFAEASHGIQPEN